jgi:hypothetical protein
MSILITESYANETTPLWNNGVSTEPTLIGNDATSTSFGFYSSTQEPIFLTPVFTDMGDAYCLTLCFIINATNISGLETTNLPVILTLSISNDIGTFQGGTQVMINVVGDASAYYTSYVSVPFVSDGNTTAICYLYNATGGSCNLNIVPCGQMLQNLGTATQTSVIFQPM